MRKKQIYQRLTAVEREEITRGLDCGETGAVIARRLGRARSTITREIGRNSGKNGYRAYSANRRAYRASSGRKGGKRRLFCEEHLRQYVISGLEKKWSPEEIVAFLKKEYPNDEYMRISHEAIYQYIYVIPRGSLKTILIKGLRQERAYRRGKRKRSGDREKRGKIADMLSIEERPKEVADRTVPGHWEGDLIMGKWKRTALGTLVERTTRYVILVPLSGKKDVESVRKAYAQELGVLPRELTRSLTYDQGKEMGQHKQFTIDTGIQVYFAHPGSPWERGTNENTNGLLRQYFPKGTDFATLTRRQIKNVQRELNDRPRKTLDWEKPDEVFNRLVALKC